MMFAPAPAASRTIFSAFACTGDFGSDFTPMTILKCSVKNLMHMYFGKSRLAWNFHHTIPKDWIRQLPHEHLLSNVM